MESAIPLEKIQFRSMRIEDIEQICAIEQEAFPTPWTYAAFKNEIIHNFYAHYLVMEVERQVIGYGGMWTVMGEAHVTNIAIRKDYRGKKLGHLLMAELQATARFLGAEKMILEVRPSNIAARELYRKYGFEPVGIRKGYYTDNHEDAIVMAAQLDELQAKEDDYENSRSKKRNLKDEVE